MWRVFHHNFNTFKKKRCFGAGFPQFSTVWINFHKLILNLCCNNESLMMLSHKIEKNTISKQFLNFFPQFF